jgi:transcriptional regulator
MCEFIQSNSFAALVSSGPHLFHATHIPLLLETGADGKEVLSGHIAKANPQWKVLQEKPDVLAIFSGPHHYISSSWYDHENVPTWNYIAVHVYGTARIIEGDRLMEHLSKLTDTYEHGRPNRVSVEGMSRGFLEREIKGLVGLEIDITRMEGAWKLSQNRDDAKYDHIIQKLNKEPDPNATVIADEMRKLRPEGKRTYARG